MTKVALLESFLLLTGGHRRLQELPDYTSPPLQIALAATPEAYRDDAVVQAARDLDAAGNCTIDGNRCHIPFPVGSGSKVGVVFYSGGLVDPRSYSPIAALVRDRYGIPVVLPIFADDLAFKFGTCDTGRLDFAQAEFPDVEKWVLAGHSFGGVAAMVDAWTRWTEMDESAAGLVLLASDVQQGLGCGNTDFSTSGLPMAQILGSNDGILNQTRLTLDTVYNSNATFVMEVYGANHASFGDYDYSQRFELLGQTDGEALIPDTVVWDLVAAAIANVAARTGVALPTPKEAGSSDSALEEVVSEDEEMEIVDRCPPVGVQGRSATASSGAAMTTVTLVSWVFASILGFVWVW